MRQSLCFDWTFFPQWDDALPQGLPRQGGEDVCLPHECREVPLHYADPSGYGMVCGYRRQFTVPDAQEAPRLFLYFEGAAHQAEVWVNGQRAGSHRGGYTAFRMEITHLVDRQGKNTLTVRLDTREDPTLPPFGFVLDYLAYGGLYRPVWLETEPEHFLSDVFVWTPTLERVQVQLTLDAPLDECWSQVTIETEEGAVLAETSFQGLETSLSVPGAPVWHPDTPTLCRCRVRLTNGAGALLDEKSVLFGFRTAEFRSDGFYLNGQRFFLRGLNRHQSYPYLGYAAPEALEREDARILRQELSCTAVRTSHYPQSRFFLEECDRLGLLVFTELPGWQHIGDEDWKACACSMLQEMILESRNHPCIILWGVRINESVDDDAFYEKTNALAHALDPSRATSGVRYLEKSRLLEDVYAYNDFSHTGGNGGVRPKEEVTPDVTKPFMVTEHNGHMFPTKSFDNVQRRQEHALRHLRVLNDAVASGVHAGCFGWCMADYPTHRDFGSGDRVCYHGVMDHFRNPKLAAYAYQSQGDGEVVLAVSSTMDIGDYPGGKIGTVYAFTNAETVKLYKNDRFVTDLQPSQWSALPHPPLAAEDTIGQMLQTQEGFSPAQAQLLRRCLLAVARYGLPELPLRWKLRFAWCMLRCRLSFEQGVALYGKYVANWGGAATAWRFDALQGGAVVKSVTLCPSHRLHLEVRTSAVRLREKDSWDAAAVRIRILDENGNLASYAQLPLHFSLRGAAALVGPAVATAEGGMGGTIVRTVGKSAEAVLTISTSQTEPVEIVFSIEKMVAEWA